MVELNRADRGIQYDAPEVNSYEIKTAPNRRQADALLPALALRIQRLYLLRSQIMGKLFYGTQTGTTDSIALDIQNALPDLIEQVTCIYSITPADFAATDFLVLGGSTWGDGELTDDWIDFWPHMDSIDFKGKKVALFALGDQYGYGHNFVSAMKQLYDKVIGRGGTVIANAVPADYFEFGHSESLLDNKFIGLVIDEVNQPELTKERIENWAAMVRQQLAVGAIPA